MIYHQPRGQDLDPAQVAPIRSSPNRPPLTIPTTIAMINDLKISVRNESLGFAIIQRVNFFHILSIRRSRGNRTHRIRHVKTTSSPEELTPVRYFQERELVFVDHLCTIQPSSDY